MDQKNLPAEDGQTPEPKDKSELSDKDLEQVSGGLLPAVQKVMADITKVSGDPHVFGMVQKVKK